MNISPYIKVLLITLIFTCFSYVIEIHNKTSINNLNKCNNLGLFVFRYIHYLFLFYFSFFLLFFSSLPKHFFHFIDYFVNIFNVYQ